MFTVAYGKGKDKTLVFQTEEQNLKDATPPRTTLWDATKWNMGKDDDKGAYANPKNGKYSRYFVKDGVEFGDSKDFELKLVLATTLQDDKPSADEISSGLVMPDKKNIRLGLKLASEQGPKVPPATVIWCDPNKLTIDNIQKADLDNDSSTPDAIKSFDVKNEMSAEVASDKYIVIVEVKTDEKFGIADVAGNRNKASTELAEVVDWTIRLR